MKRAVVTFLSLLPLACASPPVVSKFVPGPGGSQDLPIEILGSNVLRVGEALKISNPGGATKMTVSFTNVRTGVSRSLTIDLDPAAPGTVALDSSVLPDLVQESKVQKFDVRIDNPTLSISMTKDIFVVSEGDVQPFPQIPWQYDLWVPAGRGPNLPPGKAPMVADPSQAGIDNYVQRLTEDWKLDKPAVKKASIPRGSVTIPDWLRSMPETIGLVEVRVGATYSKYLVPDLHSQSGEFDVYSPTQMSFVLTETNPAVLVRLTALPPTAPK